MKKEIKSEIASMKSMMESCFTYGGIEKGSHYYEEYLLPYREKLGETLFEKIYAEHSKHLEGYKVVKDVFTDAEGLSYNSLVPIN